MGFELGPHSTKSPAPCITAVRLCCWFFDTRSSIAFRMGKKIQLKVPECCSYENHCKTGSHDWQYLQLGSYACRGEYVQRVPNPRRKGAAQTSHPLTLESTTLRVEMKSWEPSRLPECLQTSYEHPSVASKAIAARLRGVQPRRRSLSTVSTVYALACAHWIGGHSAK